MDEPDGRSAEAGRRPAAATDDESPVARQDHLGRSRPAVVRRGERGAIRAGIADRHEVPAPERRQVVLSELVGRFADRAVDGGERLGLLDGQGRPSIVRGGGSAATASSPASASAAPSVVAVGRVSRGFASAAGTCSTGTPSEVKATTAWKPP